MIHSIKIEDKTVSGKKILEVARKSRKGVEIEKTVMSRVIPERYVTSDIFWDNIKKGVIKKLEDNGYL